MSPNHLSSELLISPTPTSNPSISPQQLNNLGNTHPMVTHLKAGITKPKKILCLLVKQTIDIEPSDYSQVVQSYHWRRAMFEEFQALQTQGTWTLMSLFPSQCLIGSK